MEKEIWKDIKGYKGFYMISSYGRIKSLKRIDNNNHFIRERILKQGDNNGYKHVSLSKNGKTKIFKVHRLVAEAFIPNPNNLPQVNHKDENHSNNCVSNLEYCDALYNDNYGTRNKRISEAHKGKTPWNKGKPHTEETRKKLSKALKGIPNIKNRKKIAQIDIETDEIIKIWDCANDIYKELGFKNSNISACCNNKPHINTAYGFNWKFF